MCRYGGTRGQNHEAPRRKLYYISYHHGHRMDQFFTKQVLNLLHSCSQTQTFSYLCAGNFSTILLLILWAFKWYVECLYRHIFLEDTCTNIKVTKKISAPQVWNSHNPRNKTPNLVCDFPKPIAVICVNQIHEVVCHWKVIGRHIMDTPQNLQYGT